MGCIPSNTQKGKTVCVKPNENKFNLEAITSLIVTQKTEEILALFDQGLDVNTKFPNLMNRTLIHIAADKGASKILKILVQKGALLDEKDSYGITPVGLAKLRNDNKTIQLLYLLGAEKEFKFNLSRTNEPSPNTPQLKSKNFQWKAKSGNFSPQV